VWAFVIESVQLTPLKIGYQQPFYGDIIIRITNYTANWKTVTACRSDYFGTSC